MRNDSSEQSIGDKAITSYKAKLEERLIRKTIESMDLIDEIEEPEDTYVYECTNLEELKKTCLIYYLLSFF